MQVQDYGGIPTKLLLPLFSVKFKRWSVLQIPGQDMHTGVAAAVLGRHGDTPRCGRQVGSCGAELQRQQKGLCRATPPESEAEE